jgi:HYDIN/CFA65/VesB family protein
VGQTTNFNVAFAPASASSVTGSVSLVSNAPNSPAAIALSGTGVAATFQLTASPTSLSFGNVLVGSSSTQSVTLTNTGNSSVSVSQISVSGTGLSTTGLTLPVTLAAGQSASFSVVFAPTVAGSVTGSVSVVSTATNSPATITLSGSGIASTSGLLCGQLDDGLIHTPPNYTTPLAPPAKGASYVDPQYGCTITRLTNAVADNLGAAAHHDYGTITPVNANDTYVMILLENGSLEIVDTTGNVIVPAANMPGTSSANVPWDTSVPTRFYYTSGATLFRADITGLPNCASAHNCSITSTTLHSFTYGSVRIPDQEDISDDGDHLWLVGDTSAFLYTISTNTVGPTMNVGTQNSGWHKIQIMPSNRMLMTWSSNGPGPGAGQEVYNTNATLAWHMFDNTIHTDCGTNLSGNEVCVAARIPDLGGNINMANACPTFTGTQDGGVDIVNMSTHAAQCLVDVNWADTEISFRDGNAGAGWVFITIFKAGTCPTYSCFDTTSPSHLSSTWATDWVHFAEEGLLVRIDSNNSTNKNRLFHTRSRSTEYYWAIPRGAVSRDGKYLVFDTNFDISNTGLVNYTDVYLVKVQ